MSTAENYEGQDLEALADIPNYQRWILDTFPVRAHGRVLEIGAGIGNLARHYVDVADETVLLEPAVNLREKLQAAFGHKANVKVVSALLEDVCGRSVEGVSFEHGTFDTVLLINVLEHVDDDAAMLGRIRSLLRPGGSVLLFVPAVEWLYGSLDALHHHRRRYTRRSLEAAASSAGLNVQFLRYFDFLGMLPWFVVGRVVKQRRFNANAARLYDRTGVPLGAWMERRLTPLIGKNLICVATRAGA